ncbi:hypothetical protein [Nocardioides sp. cx-173]|uniref:hypothetical protein n=1 Tax=Nocardioides sp. cx-173 TaxID=2898796 RepID=UPI001E63A682|nr:hypothetical protein [Nocardioides sp. cx-173]MCD4526700.1 hypothetical protein [Nocardioides sp. cx-173]UGB42558.1 hypothetical protein LQ940_03295 [Nocardioides sp. cx-173]
MSDGYSRGAFEAALNDVGDLLGDLWAVDETLKLGDRDAMDDRGGASPSGYRTMVDVGRHHRFQFGIFTELGDASSEGQGDVGPIHFGAAQKLADEIAETGRGWGRAAAESFRTITEDMIRPVPSSFGDAVQSMRSEITEPLSILVRDDFASLSSLGDWDGEAATEFADYYRQVEASVGTQVYAAESVCMGLAGSKAIVHLGQHSLMNLVLSAKAALDEQLEQRQASHSTSGTSTKEVLLIGATVAGVIAAIPTGGTSLTLAAGAAAAAGATSSLLQFAAENVEEGDTEEFTVTSAQESVEQLFGHLETIRSRVRANWTALDERIESTRTLLAQAETEHLLYPRRPRLMADGHVSPGGWHHESAPR